MIEEKDQLLRIGKVLEITSLSKSVLYEMVREGEFPRPVRIGKRSARWRQGDIEAWLQSRPPATEMNWH